MAGSIVILALLSMCHLAIGSGPIIKTRFGVIEGWEGVSRNGRPYEAWTKIPYALPPVGQLRFQAPQPAKPWNGTYNGTSLTPACMQSLPPTQADQPPSESTGMMFEESPPEPVPVTVVTEDCLYLDVYRTKGLNKTNVPVLVYLPGDLSTGHVGDKHSADFLMDEDIILVQVNYRVGGLGFMSLGSKVMPGNYGLKDQVLALKWVNATIRDFGGNPKSVTVFGETSPHYLMKSRLSQNLVARAVTHSGTVNQGSTLLNGNIVKNNTANVARQLNCLKKTHQDILKCLQNVDSDKILSAIQLLTESSDPLQVLFAPVVEPKAVKQAFALQDILVRPSRKPWMHSFSNGEYQVYLAILKEKLDYVDSVRANVTIYLENWLKNRVTDPIKLQNGVAILQKKYFSVRSSVHAFAKELAKFHADANFIYPSIFHMKRHTGSKYVAELEYSSSISPLSPILYIAGHAAHTDYYFNRTDIGSLSPKYEDVSKRLIKYLVNFASNGKPTPKRATVNWKPFKTDEILRINGATDFIGDKTFFPQFQTIHDLWYSVVGWN